jgi:hypothetical protein
MMEHMFKGGDISMCPFLNMQKKKEEKKKESRKATMA